MKATKGPCFVCGRGDAIDTKIDSGRVVKLCTGNGGCATDRHMRESAEKMLDRKPGYTPFEEIQR